MTIRRLYCHRPHSDARLVVNMDEAQTTERMQANERKAIRQQGYRIAREELRTYSSEGLAVEEVTLPSGTPRK